MTHHELNFRWLGVGGFEWTMDEYTLLLDPFLTRPSLWQVLTRRLTPRTEWLERHIPQANAILISHAHYDHLMDAPYLAQRTGAVIYGSPNTIEIARLHGVPVEQLHIMDLGEEFHLGPFDLTLIAGQHVPLPGISSGPLPGDLELPLPALAYRMDRCDSSLIKADGLRWLVWHSIETAGAPEADVLVVGPEGDPAYFRALCSRVNPRLLIPIHWENFFRTLEKPLKQLPVRRSFPRELNLGQGQVAPWDLGQGLHVPVFSPPPLEPCSVEDVLS
jgi:L-ascorbate metabolism protein UlaG (beta-lactamase superfamily)